VKYLLDTHVWIWWNLNPSKLSKKVIKIITDTKNYDEMLLSAISIWEFCKLVEKKRIVLSCDTEEWINNAIVMPKFRIVQLTSTISYKSTSLPAPFHNDPADQIIVATAREENATILTSDHRILNYKNARVLWK
jgi:PIN domain nuclease of toxin-antitoxin system